MNRAGSLEVTTPGDREIAMRRVFDAPRQLVFDAHTKPDLLRRWLLGPDGWEMPVCEVDLRVGGRYRYVWRNLESGEEMASGGVFREIDPPARIVQTESFEDPWYEGESIVTLELTERGGKTVLVQTMLYTSKEVRDAVLASGMEGGVEVSYDRLATILAS